MPQANSMTSRPRWMSPLLSAMTLPCSDGQDLGQFVHARSTRRLNSNITRARRCGLTSAQVCWARSADCTALSTSASLANWTRACTSPVLGLKTSPKRPGGAGERGAVDEVGDLTHGRAFKAPTRASLGGFRGLFSVTSVAAREPSPSGGALDSPEVSA
jgi:hypothetical protein